MIVATFGLAVFAAFNKLKIEMPISKLKKVITLFRRKKNGEYILIITQNNVYYV
jgi:hypothetical protein